MSKPSSLTFAGLAFLASVTAATAAERVGEAVKINTWVLGAEGIKNEGDAVYRNEVVRASATGLGQFEFNDGTKLAIGPNASVVIDKYVLGEGGTLKKLTLRATKGTFRFIGGRSPPSAYTILTPAGTMGVRGTATEVQILPDGRVIYVQLEGTSEVCTNPKDRRTCRVLNKPCDFVVANGKTGEITDPKQISDEVVDPENFPLLRDNSKKLIEGFNLGGIGCGLSQSASSISPALPAAVLGGVLAAVIAVLANEQNNDQPDSP